MPRVKQADLEAAYNAAERFIEGLTDDEVNSMSPRTLDALRNLASYVTTLKRLG